MAAGTIDRSTVTVVRGSGGTPGTIGRSTVAVVRGSGGTPGTIGRSTVVVVIDTNETVELFANIRRIIGAVSVLINIPPLENTTCWVIANKPVPGWIQQNCASVNEWSNADCQHSGWAIPSTECNIGVCNPDNGVY